MHAVDWPYERAPLAERCAAGWRAVADACRAARRARDRLARPRRRAGIVGLQPARRCGRRRGCPRSNTREVPKWMEADDIAAVIAGFARTRPQLAVDAGCDGVEINAGQHSLVRQFLSGLTNQRDDEWGTDRLRVRPRGASPRCGRRSAPNGVVGLRLSCDELAPWAGITPDMAPDIAAERSPPRASTTSSWRGARSSRPRRRGPTSTSRPASTSTCAARCERAVDVPVILQGLDRRRRPGRVGARRYDDGVCDGVEMTRAQIADPDLVAKLARGRGRPDPAVHPLQPDVPGARRPQPDRHVRRRADERPRDRGSRLVRSRRARPRRSWWSAAGPPGWRRPGSRRSAATT